MNKRGKKGFLAGLILLAVFVLWTVLVLCVDVQPVGQQGTDVGFAALNVAFHKLTGEHMGLYELTDLLEVVPFLVCICFGALGLVQWIRRKKLKKVDLDIRLLGVYYVLVIAVFVLFELITINYRPVLIEGKLEGSYPSSTTLLVLSVMPTLAFQVNRRAKSPGVRLLTTVFVAVFTAFMVLGRLISGVHWLSDILGGVLLGVGLYLLYRSAVATTDRA